MKIILASQSPRRKEILESLGIDFEVVPANCNEMCDKTAPNEIVMELAERKAKSVNLPGIIIGSDTIVVHNNVVFGKPKDKDDAFKMLKQLQDSWHEVYTGVCVIKDSPITYYECSHVHMKRLSDNEIWDYIDTGEPMDKAGAYAIQGIGAKLIDEYKGEFETIMGLPIKRLKTLLV
ncbi:MAG: Maf family protein [Coriobacteriia bacterium]|nr:Maf family protein [Coriobacteriia bacterium]